MPQEGESSNQIEFYIAGHVAMRYISPKGETETLFADEVYYDVSRSVAVATQGELVMRDPKLPYPMHMKAPILYQLNAQTFEAQDSDVFSTVLPSDPGLQILLRKSRVIERKEVRKNIFGIPRTDPKTGEPLVESLRYFTGRDMIITLEGLPIFYWPYYTANVEEPMGPLRPISGNYSKIFGMAVYTTWDMYSLLGMRRLENTGWQLYLDYMSQRGPAWARRTTGAAPTCSVCAASSRTLPSSTASGTTASISSARAARRSRPARTTPSHRAPPSTCRSRIPISAAASSSASTPRTWITASGRRRRFRCSATATSFSSITSGSISPASIRKPMRI